MTQKIEMSHELPATNCICGRNFTSHEELLTHLLKHENNTDHAQQGWREEREQRTANG